MFGAFSGGPLGLGIRDLGVGINPAIAEDPLGIDIGDLLDNLGGVNPAFEAANQELMAEVAAHPISLALHLGHVPAVGGGGGGGRGAPPVMAVPEGTGAGAAIGVPAATGAVTEAEVTMDDVRAGEAGDADGIAAASAQTVSANADVTGDGAHSELSYDLETGW